MTIKQNGGIFGRKPTFSTLDVDSSENGTALTVTSSGSGHNIDLVDSTATGRIRNVGGRLHFVADLNDESASSAIRFYVDNNRKVDIDENGNIVFDGSGQGIDFSATEGSGATSSILNDYERGTFNPDLLNVTKTYTSRTGVYTKIGAFVHCSMYFDIASIDTSDTSVILIGGLPYANTNLRGYGLLDQRSSSVITTPLNNRYVRPYSTTIVSLSGDDSSSDSKYNQLGATSGTFRLYFTYETDS